MENLSSYHYRCSHCINKSDRLAYMQRKPTVISFWTNRYPRVDFNLTSATLNFKSELGIKFGIKEKENNILWWFGTGGYHSLISTRGNVRWFVPQYKINPMLCAQLSSPWGVFLYIASSSQPRLTKIKRKKKPVKKQWKWIIEKTREHWKRFPWHG